MRRQPLDHRLRPVLGALGIAKRRLGLGMEVARAGGGGTGTGDPILDRGARLGRGLHRRLGRRTFGLQRGEPVAPLHPLRRCRAAALADIAVPAPQPPLARDQPLPDAEMLARIRLDQEDLRQPPGKRRRRLDPRAQRQRADRRGGVLGRDGGAVPVDQRRLQFVTQRGGQRALEPRLGLHLVEQPVAALARGRADQRRGLGLQRGQGGDGAGAGALGRIALGRGGQLAFLGPAQSRARLVGIDPGGGLGCDRRFACRFLLGHVGQRLDRRRNGAGIAFGAGMARAGGGQCGLGDAALGGLRRLGRQGAGQRDLGIAVLRLRLGQQRVEPGHGLHRMGDARLQILAFLGQPPDRGGRVMRQRVLTRAILVDAGTRGGQFLDPPLQPIAAVSGARQGMARLA